MATASKVGRNEPCPCGSGKKYKACCGKTKGGTRDMSVLEWVVVAVVVVAVAVVFSSIFKSEGENDATTRRCPPGESWSAEHGHCH